MAAPRIRDTADGTLEFVSPRSFVGYVLGIPFVIAGAVLGVIPLPMNLFQLATGSITGAQFLECVPGVLIGMVIGLPLLVVGWMLAFLRTIGRVNDENLTVINDYLLWRTSKAYPLREIQWLMVDLHIRRVKTERGLRSTSVRVQAVTRSEEVLLGLGTLKDVSALRSFGAELAERTGISIRDHT